MIDLEKMLDKLKEFMIDIFGTLVMFYFFTVFVFLTLPWLAVYASWVLNR